MSTSFQHAGLVHNGPAGYRLTTLGQSALDQNLSADQIYQIGDDGYRAWDASREERLHVPAPSEQQAVLHPGIAGHALRATDELLAAWRGGGSALSTGASVWTAESTGRLHAYLAAAPQQLTLDLPGLVDDTARLLAAEALALVAAPVKEMGGSDRRYYVRGPLLRMTEVPPPLPIQLSADLEHGFVPVGKAFTADPAAMLRSIVTILQQWWHLPPAARGQAWEDPWAWRDTLAAMPDTDERAVGLLNVAAHPGSFANLVRRQDREQVVAAFTDLVTEPSGDTDRDLIAVVVGLQKQYGGAAVDLTVPPLVRRWSGEPESGGAWLVRGQVDQRNRVPGWLQHANVTLTVSRFRQLPDPVTHPALVAMVEDLYSEMSVVKREAKKRDVTNVALGMRPGDLVATDDDGQLRLGRVAEGALTLDAVGGLNLLLRPVVWSPEPAGKITELPGAVKRKLRFRGEDVVNITDLLADLEDLESRPVDVSDVIDLKAPSADEEVALPIQPPPAVAQLTCDIEEVAHQLHHTDSRWLRELVETLNERHQVILEGPPGTGKTFVVQRLLEACGLTANEQALVQFHPTYSYEDFVEGFRPSGSDASGPRLVVVPGPLKRIADEARENPGRPHVLVIDEINRANIAKVFGELYFLLEYREAEIELLYSDGKERFSLPPNLFILGTMNTADRSIALLDAAMRRRFVFMSMDSAEPSLAEVLSRWCKAHDVPVALAGLRDRINSRMLATGLEPSLQFGPSYFMRTSLNSGDALSRLWRRELLPMLLEHHYANDEIIETYRFDQWCAELGLRAERSHEGEPG